MERSETTVSTSIPTLTTFECEHCGEQFHAHVDRAVVAIRCWACNGGERFMQAYHGEASRSMVMYPETYGPTLHAKKIEEAADSTISSCIIYRDNAAAVRWMMVHLPKYVSDAVEVGQIEHTIRSRFAHIEP